MGAHGLYDCLLGFSFCQGVPDCLCSLHRSVSGCLERILRCDSSWPAGTIAFAYGGHNVVLEIQVRFPHHHRFPDENSCLVRCVYSLAAASAATRGPPPSLPARAATQESIPIQMRRPPLVPASTAAELLQDLANALRCSKLHTLRMRKPAAQATMPSPPSTLKPYMRGVYLAYAIVSWCYAGVAFSGELLSLWSVG